MKKVGLVLLTLLVVAPLRAQPFRHLNQTYEPPNYSSLEAWLGRAEELRTHLLVSTGLWPRPEPTPLHPRVGTPLERDGYTVQTVVLETWPGFYLTGNLYRPRGGSGPFPAVLSTHGHWQEGRLHDDETASVPGRAIHFARQGYVVFTYSMLGYNETAAFPHRVAAPRYELWGFGVMGLQLWNSLRALDFVSTLPDVDPNRIGMTGASGGGTQTFMLTAVDDRIRVAAPVNMISTHMQGGCVCENAPLLRIEAINTEIGALAAPRPLLMVSTSGDWTRNTPEVEYPAIRSVYRLFDAEEHVANVHLDYPHNYNRDSREAVYRWFDRWLLGRDAPVEETPFTVEAPADLLAELPQPMPTPDELFGQFSARAKAQIREAKPADWPGIYTYREMFGPALQHALTVEGPAADPDLEAYLPASRTEAGPAVLLVHSGGAAAAQQARARAADYRHRGVAAFLLALPAREDAPPDSINHWTTYNPTAAARQVDQIRRAGEAILRRPDVTRLDLTGLGAAGPPALLARALVPGIHHTTIDFDGFDAASDETFLDRLFIPLLRRAGDFRTASVLIAPAPLTLQNLPVGPLRRWIEDVYGAAGAAEMVRFE